jgi:hypothetical protein
VDIPVSSSITVKVGADASVVGYGTNLAQSRAVIFITGKTEARKGLDSPYFSGDGQLALFTVQPFHTCAESDGEEVVVRALEDAPDATSERITPFRAHDDSTRAVVSLSGLVVHRPGDLQATVRLKAPINLFDWITAEEHQELLTLTRAQMASRK